VLGENILDPRFI